MNNPSPNHAAPTAATTGMAPWLFGLLVGVAVVVAGIGSMFALVWISGGSDAATCAGRVELGYAPDIYEQTEAEPDPQAINERCRWWYALDPEGRLVAYKVAVPGRNCDVWWDYANDLWQCETGSVDVSELEEWPSTIEDVDDRKQMFIVDFGEP